jgi:hypothetical protein
MSYVSTSHTHCIELCYQDTLLHKLHKDTFNYLFTVIRLQFFWRISHVLWLWSQEICGFNIRQQNRGVNIYSVGQRCWQHGSNNYHQLLLWQDKHPPTLQVEISSKYQQTHYPLGLLELSIFIATFLTQEFQIGICPCINTHFRM